MRSVLIICLFFVNAFASASEQDCARAFEVLNTNWSKFQPVDQSKTTIGIEVEGAIPDFSDRLDVAKEIQNILRRMFEQREESRVQIPILTSSGKWGLEYNVQYWRNHKPKIIKVVHDPSIPKNHGLPTEIVSPVMSESEDMKIFLDVLSSLKHEFKMNPLTSHSGVHVHVGFPKYRYSEIASLVAIFTLIEPRLLNVFSVQAPRQRFTTPIQNIYSEVHPNERQDLRGLKALIFSDDGDNRYLTLNIMSLEQHGTVEFRFLNSTLNPALIHYTVDFCTKLVQAVRTKNEKLYRYLMKAEPKEVRLNHIASILDMDMANRQQEIQELMRLDSGTPVNSYIGIPYQNLFKQNAVIQAQLVDEKNKNTELKKSHDQKLFERGLAVAVISAAVTGSITVFLIWLM